MCATVRVRVCVCHCRCRCRTSKCEKVDADCSDLGQIASFALGVEEIEAQTVISVDVEDGRLQHTRHLPSNQVACAQEVLAFASKKGKLCGCSRMSTMIIVVDTGRFRRRSFQTPRFGSSFMSRMETVNVSQYGH